jgi:hypothetical protein
MAMTTPSENSRAVRQPIVSAGTQVPEAELAAAERLLAETADAVNPGTAKAEILGYLVAYRARVAALVAACRSL